MSSLRPRLKRSAYTAFGAVAGLAAMAIWGWAIDVPVLRDFGADFAMSASAAIAFLLLASLSRGRAAPSLMRAAALAVAVGLAALVEHYLALELHADRAGGALTLVLLAFVMPLPAGTRAFGAAARRGRGADRGGRLALLGLRFAFCASTFPRRCSGFPRRARSAMLAAIGLAAARPTRWLLETLAGRSTGAVVRAGSARGVHHAVARSAGRGYSPSARDSSARRSACALFTTVMIAGFGALVLWVACTLEDHERKRAQAEEQAGETREWLQVTLAAIGDGVIATDREGRVRFLNAAAQRLTGWRAAEAAGRPIEELVRLFDERNNAHWRIRSNPA